MLLNLIVFLLVLSVLIFVHELGHFLAAKAMHIGVNEFGIGFPPKLIARKRGDTTYSINWLPFGGFVKLKGMDSGSEEADSYHLAPVLKRIVVVVAGVAMNILLAFVILSLAYLIGFSPATQPLAEYPGAQVLRQAIIIAEVIPGSPAEQVGIEPGDIIELADGQAIASTDDFQSFTNQHAGEQIDLSLNRGGTTVLLHPTLPKVSSAPLGVAILSDSIIRLPFWQAIRGGWHETWGLLQAIGQLFVDLIKQVFVQHSVPADVVGPVGIYQATSSALQLGWPALTSLVVILTLNLALVNILPIPALDGGYLLFLLAELVFRKKVIKERVESILVTFGFMLMILLFIIMTWRDVIRFG